MCSFWKAKELGNPMVGSKVMALGNELVHFAQFSRYLNRFDSDFNPWVVVGKGIQYSLQWHWSQLVLMVGSKLGFFMLSMANFGTNLIKIGQSWRKPPNSTSLTKKHEKCCFEVVLTNFDLWSTLGWLGAFCSIWPKRHFEYSDARMGVPCQSRCFHSPLEKS